MNPLAFLQTKDDFERILMQEIAKRAFKSRQLLDKQLANMIASEVSKIFG